MRAPLLPPPRRAARPGRCARCAGLAPYGCLRSIRSVPSVVPGDAQAACRPHPAPLSAEPTVAAARGCDAAVAGHRGQGFAGLRHSPAVDARIGRHVQLGGDRVKEVSPWRCSSTWRRACTAVRGSRGRGGTVEQGTRRPLRRVQSACAWDGTGTRACRSPRFESASMPERCHVTGRSRIRSPSSRASVALTFTLKVRRFSPTNTARR